MAELCIALAAEERAAGAVLGRGLVDGCVLGKSWLWPVFSCRSGGSEVYVFDSTSLTFCSPKSISHRQGSPPPLAYQLVCTRAALSLHVDLSCLVL